MSASQECMHRSARSAFLSARNAPSASCGMHSMKKGHALLEVARSACPDCVESAGIGQASAENPYFLPANATAKEAGPQCEVITFCVSYHSHAANPSSAARFSAASCAEGKRPGERTKKMRSRS